MKSMWCPVSGICRYLKTVLSGGWSSRQIDRDYVPWEDLSLALEVTELPKSQEILSQLLLQEFLKPQLNFCMQ